MYSLNIKNYVGIKEIRDKKRKTIEIVNIIDSM